MRSDTLDDGTAVQHRIFVDDDEYDDASSATLIFSQEAQVKEVNGAPVFVPAQSITIKDFDSVKRLWEILDSYFKHTKPKE